MSNKRISQLDKRPKTVTDKQLSTILELEVFVVPGYLSDIGDVYDLSESGAYSVILHAEADRDQYEAEYGEYKP
jgi:hypothetical protein